MHAVTMDHLLKPLESLLGKKVTMLDVGCGKGYSTLAYALLANQVLSMGKRFEMTGVDYHSHFMERATLNYQKYQTHLQRGTVKFRPHDYIRESLPSDTKYDMVTFGFEVSLDVL